MRMTASGGAPGRERGASLVEAALITPLFFMLIFGILELGLVSHDQLVVGNMSMVGSRTGTTRGNDLLGDHEIVQAVNAAALGLPRGRIQVVVVYDAGGPDGQVPEACAAGAGQAGVCNVYTGTMLGASASTFGCGPSAPDRFWCPTSRQVAETTAGGGPTDYLGVYVRVVHPSLTGMFGQGWTLTSDTVLRIEARKV